MAGRDDMRYIIAQNIINLAKKHPYEIRIDRQNVLGDRSASFNFSDEGMLKVYKKTVSCWKIMWFLYRNSHSELNWTGNRGNFHRNRIGYLWLSASCANKDECVLP